LLMLSSPEPRKPGQIAAESAPPPRGLALLWLTGGMSASPPPIPSRMTSGAGCEFSAGLPVGPGVIGVAPGRRPGPPKGPAPIPGRPPAAPGPGPPPMPVGPGPPPIGVAPPPPSIPGVSGRTGGSEVLWPGVSIPPGMSIPPGVTGPEGMSGLPGVTVPGVSGTGLPGCVAPGSGRGAVAPVGGVPTAGVACPVPGARSVASSTWGLAVSQSTIASAPMAANPAGIPSVTSIAR